MQFVCVRNSHSQTSTELEKEQIIDSPVDVNELFSICFSNQ